MTAAPAITGVVDDTGPVANRGTSRGTTAPVGSTVRVCRETTQVANTVNRMCPDAKGVVVS